MYASTCLMCMRECAMCLNICVNVPMAACVCLQGKICECVSIRFEYVNVNLYVLHMRVYAFSSVVRTIHAACVCVCVCVSSRARFMLCFKTAYTFNCFTALRYSYTHILRIHESIHTCTHTRIHTRVSTYIGIYITFRCFTALR